MCIRKSIPLLIFLLVGIMSTQGYAQSMYLPDFLRSKQVWDEKLVVIYAPESMQHTVKEQINLMYPDLYSLTKEKIVVVQIPARLSEVNQQFLNKKLKAQTDRLNIWVFDEKGNLRMTSTKLTPVSSFLRVLNLEARSSTLARVQPLHN